MRNRNKITLSLGTVRFLPVNSSHAKFILTLRSNDSLNQHLSPTPLSILAQQQWIEEYQSREREGKELYFLIQEDEALVGTVRIYDIAPNQFTWGSWIIRRGQPVHVAISSAFLVYQIGFHDLDIPTSIFEVRNANHSTLKFHKNMGAKVISQTSESTRFLMTKEALSQAKTKYSRFI